MAFTSAEELERPECTFSITSGSWPLMATVARYFRVFSRGKSPLIIRQLMRNIPTIRDVRRGWSKTCMRKVSASFTPARRRRASTGIILANSPTLPITPACMSAVSLPTVSTELDSLNDRIRLG